LKNEIKPVENEVFNLSSMQIRYTIQFYFWDQWCMMGLAA
jgi:hypothetical protein